MCPVHASLGTKPPSVTSRGIRCCIYVYVGHSMTPTMPSARPRITFQSPPRQPYRGPDTPQDTERPTENFPALWAAHFPTHPQDHTLTLLPSPERRVPASPKPCPVHIRRWVASIAMHQWHCSGSRLCRCRPWPCSSQAAEPLTRHLHPAPAAGRPSEWPPRRSQCRSCGSSVRGDASSA